MRRVVKAIAGADVPTGHELVLVPSLCEHGRPRTVGKTVRTPAAPLVQIQARERHGVTEGGPWATCLRCPISSKYGPDSPIACQAAERCGQPHTRPGRNHSARSILTGSILTARITAGTAANDAAAKRASAGNTSIGRSVAFT
jgi:hypothetical protein